MFRKSLAVLLSAGILLGGGLAPALAESGPVSVKVNNARILRIDAPAATVIIGNPGVADVTIQDPQTLVLTGKSYGRTNLIILDNGGNPIADTIIEVTRDVADTVTVYMAGSRQSYTCAPECQSIVIVGDDPGYTEGTIRSSNSVSGFARSN